MEISFPPNQLRTFLQILKAGVAVSRQNFFDIFRVVSFDFLFHQRVVRVDYLVYREKINEIHQLGSNRENDDVSERAISWHLFDMSKDENCMRKEEKSIFPAAK